MSNEAIALYEQPTRHPERSDPAFFLRDAFHRGRGTQSNGSLFDLFLIANHQSRRQSPQSLRDPCAKSFLLPPNPPTSGIIRDSLHAPKEAACPRTKQESSLVKSSTAAPSSASASMKSLSPVACKPPAKSSCIPAPSSSSPSSPTNASS